MVGGHTRSGLLVLPYHWLVGIIGILLASYHAFSNPVKDLRDIAGILLVLGIFQIATALFHFRYRRFRVFVSFQTAFTLATLLTLGTVAAIWISIAGVSAVFLHRMLQKRSRTGARQPLFRDVGILLFNSGVSAMSWLAASWVYLVPFHGELPLTHLNFSSFIVIVVTVSMVSVLSYILIYISDFLSGRNWEEYLNTFLANLLSSLVMVPIGIVLALSLNGLGIAVFLLLGSTILICSFVIKRFISIRYNLEDRLRQVNYLNRISKKIIALREEEEVITLLSEEMGSIAESDSWLIARVDEWKKLHVYSSSNGTTLPDSHPLLMIASQAAQTGQPLVISNAKKDASHQYRDVLLENSVRSSVVVPLLVTKKIYGVLALYSREPYVFREEHLHVLLMIADQAALALENSKLYQALMGKVNELEDLNTELRQLDRLKSEFLANVSHELRTPLTSIKGYVEYIKKEKLGPITAMQSEGLGVAQRNILRLQRLINDLLDYTKLEFNKSPMQLRPCKFENICSDVLEQYEEAIERRNLIVQVKVPPDLPVLLVDIQRFTQVLTNLIGNAFKFSKERGIISIKAQVIHHPGPFFHFETYASNCIVEALVPVEITIADEGIGIPPEALPRIFDRFYQVDSSHTRKYGGTGLGLALVKSICDAHGIPIEVQSKLGRGTTFGIVVPSLHSADLAAAVKPNKTETVSVPKYLT